MYRIFCVEDDETIGKMIKRHLEKWEYDVHVAKNLSQVMTEFAAFDPQLVLMDIRLPFYNGYYWCTEIRKVSNVPVIFLSSVADNMNIVMAMNMGGDDFIPKPFDLEVLTAKIQALLRRSYDFAGNSSIMEHKGAVLNLMDATLTWAGLQLLLQMERGEQENAESGERMTEEYHIKQLQNLTDMEEELFRIEEYVGMALQYQRLNSNSNDYILKPISLDTVIREVIHKYARIMIRRKIRLHYEKTNVSVISDEKWLAFVLEQLLSNAVKYTPGGELTIEVQEEPQQIWLKIRDTGIGIRSEDIPRVFEKGYTGFNGHEDKRSTGIGLYLCRDALQKLGHTIRIQSEIGEGTVVTVGFYKDTIDVRD